MLLLGLFACGPTPLWEGFEAEITQGWICDNPASTPEGEPLTVYLALDAAQHFRIQVSLPSEGALFPIEDPDFLSPSFLVYTGRGLIIDNSENKCDDVIAGGQQRLDYVYAATEGNAVLVFEGERIGLQTEGIVLHANNELLGAPGASRWEDLPPVVLGDVTLPSLPNLPTVSQLDSL